MDVAMLITLFISGIGRGMIYFLLAAGLTLIFGVLNVINFAHGTFYMLGVFLCYSLTKWLNFAAAFIITPIILALIGALSEFTLFRRIYKAEHAMQLLLSLGVAYMISDIVRISYGGKPITVPMPYALRGLYVFQDIFIPKYNLFIIVVSVIITIFLYLILYKTKVGIAIRACAIDSEMTSSAGVDVPKVYLLVFMAGVGLAGMASVTAGPIVAGLLGMDLTMIIVAFCIVIIGGVGNIGGTLATALIVGIVEALGILLLPEFAEIFVYIIVVIVLIFRPSGLFAKAGV